MIRILAHHVVFEGRSYPLSIVEISDNCRSLSISAFVRETPNTTFVPGTVTIAITPEGTYQILKS